MSVFHRIDEIESLPTPVFYRLVTRLGFYAGACAGRAQMLLAEAQAKEAEASSVDVERDNYWRGKGFLKPGDTVQKVPAEELVRAWSR